ncbi:unnamed protein product [Malus baccata var. baccata]
MASSASEYRLVLSKIATNEKHGENSPYYDRWKAYNQNPFHPNIILSGSFCPSHCCCFLGIFISCFQCFFGYFEIVGAITIEGDNLDSSSPSEISLKSAVRYMKS